jgi:uncharacterized protein
VQTFEAAVRNWLGMPSSGMCVFEDTCGLGLALEHKGDVYACDHFVEPDYRLGNIMEPAGGGTPPLLEMLTSERQRRFGLDKRDALPGYCRDCDVLFACHGECPKNRFIRVRRISGRSGGKPAPQGEPGLNYLCAGWRAFFHRINGPLQLMKALMHLGRPASEIMSILAREEVEWQQTSSEARARKRLAAPCPCGSDLRFGQCHGWERELCGRSHRHARQGRPRPPVRAGVEGLAGSEPTG